jgi:hypothetical protein
MIRRETIAADGQPAWILITQIQHARLAGRIASAWQLDELPCEIRHELIWATAHHDDGWAEWDEQFELDRQGRPISFLEMPADRSVEIWSLSIQRTAAHSPLAGFLVAEHFLRLRSSASWAQQPEACEFARRTSSKAANFLQQSLQQSPGLADESTLQSAGQSLRRFDLLSLQLCCGSDPRMTEVGDAVNGPPQLWLMPKTRVSVVALEVPARHYASAQELKRQAVKLRLRWTLGT